MVSPLLPGAEDSGGAGIIVGMDDHRMLKSGRQGCADDDFGSTFLGIRLRACRMKEHQSEAPPPKTRKLICDSIPGNGLIGNAFIPRRTDLVDSRRLFPES